MLRRVVIFAAVLACALGKKIDGLFFIVQLKKKLFRHQIHRKILFAAIDEGTAAERDQEQPQPMFNGQQFKQAVETHDRVSKNPSQNCVSIDDSKIKYTLYTR